MRQPETPTGKRPTRTPAYQEKGSSTTHQMVLTCHHTHTYPLVTGSPILLSSSNTVLRRGEGDR
jgi:hypothetical protein